MGGTLKRELQRTLKHELQRTLKRELQREIQRVTDLSFLLNGLNYPSFRSEKRKEEDCFTHVECRRG